MTVWLKIAQVKAKIAYSFNDKDLTREALQVAGSTVTKSGDRYIDDGNKRLASLGDRVAELIVTLGWYKTRHTRCQYSDAKAIMTSDQNFADVGRQLGLFACLNLNPNNRVDASKEIMAAVVEAIFGAVYLDSNESVDDVRKVMNRMGITYAKHLGTRRPAVTREDRYQTSQLRKMQIT